MPQQTWTDPLMTYLIWYHLGYVSIIKCYTNYHKYNDNQILLGKSNNASRFGTSTSTSFGRKRQC